MVLALQETTSWMWIFEFCQVLFFLEADLGSTTLPVSDRFCNVQKSRRSEERCAAVLFGSVMVTSVYALDSAKDCEEYETFLEDETKVLHEGRREGARRFVIAGNLNIEFGLNWTDEDQEMQEMCGAQCWHGIDADPEGFKKTMSLEIVKEFNFDAVSTKSSCDDRRERAFTPRAWGEKWKDFTSRLHPGTETWVRVNRICTMRSSYAVHGIITLCVCYDTRRRTRSFVCSKKKRMGRFEADHR